MSVDNQNHITAYCMSLAARCTSTLVTGMYIHYYEYYKWLNY